MPQSFTSAFDFFSPAMWPLWACSITLLTLIIEKLKSLQASRILDPDLTEKIFESIKDLDIKDAEGIAERSDTLIGKAWAQGLHEFSLGGISLHNALTEASELALKPLKKYLSAIATIGVISPLLGLLGTIIGMIITFSHISAATGGSADKAALAGGISMALFTTAAGLIIAIPAIISGRYFSSKIIHYAEFVEADINKANYLYNHSLSKQKAKIDEKDHS